ncbi:MAG: hypothetical protein V4649_01790 [Bacteroidota bacterium]
MSNYTADVAIVDQLWLELANAYTAPGRYYHTLTHLENMYAALAPHLQLLQNKDAVLFALFWHDAVYDVLRPDNEEQSAELATKCLQLLNVPAATVSSCAQVILATKDHKAGGKSDTDLFTDADLSILGAPWDKYEDYAANVRQEYSVYPDALYNPGRKKVLTHFLGMERIFKTAQFYDIYETAARENIAREIALL